MGIEEELSVNYDSHFNEKDIKRFIEEKISSETANAYNLKRFNSEEVLYLAKREVPPEIADKYDPRFNGKEISWLYFSEKDDKIWKIPWRRVLPEQAQAYDSRFTADCIKHLVQAHISPDRANIYPQHFSGQDISYLVGTKKPLKKILEYPQRFNGEEITYFVKERIQPKKANSYDSSFTGSEIIQLVKSGISPKRALQHGRELLEEDEAPLPEIIDDFEPKLRFHQQVAGQDYDLRFNGQDIGDLLTYHIPNSIAAEYEDYFSGDDIRFLVGVEITPQQAKEFGRISGKEIYALSQVGVSAQEFSQLHQKLSVENIFYFQEENIPLQAALEYNSHFDGTSIIELIEEGIPADIANGYYEELSVHDIIWLYRKGVTPKNFPSKKQKKLYAFINEIRNSEEDLPPGDLELITTGSDALILLDQRRQRVYKASDVIYKEAELLEHLLDNTDLTHIVSFQELRHVGNVEVMQLEYIQGKTLEQLLDKEKNVLSNEKTLRYGKGVFEGLQELRSCHIYHRDLWLGNIIIEEQRDEAIIIDLGIATNDPQADPLHNRRYGGENDLQSLGQIMYKMATGHHLFNTTIDKSTHRIPLKIKKERERSYQSPLSIEQRLHQIEENISDGTIKEIIKMCILARGDKEDYRQIEQKFKE